MQVYPVAATVSVASALLRQRRLARIAAVTDHAVYAATADSEPADSDPTDSDPADSEPADSDPAGSESPASCLVTPSAVRVPCALVLGAGAPVPDARVGDVALIGGGELVLGGVAYRPSRWWRPARPRIAAPPPAVHPPPLDADTGAVVADLADALASGAPLASPVAALLGRGPGLTPLGDDVLAGALVALVAAGSPAGPRLATEVRKAAFRCTTFVSAALLWHAARGECVPELAALLTGAPGAAEALLRVGHTSGAGLAHGVRAAQTIVREVPS